MLCRTNMRCPFPISPEICLGYPVAKESLHLERE
jgi:hypothetical protein